MFIVIECQLFPGIDYFKKLVKGKHIKIEICESFQKMSFRNRYVLAGANGLQTLTIPVVGGREQKTSITKVKIDYSTDWATKHWRSITSGYSKAPFFDYYSADVKSFLFSKEPLLFHLNMKILNWLCEVMRIGVAIEFTERFRRDYEPQTDLRNQSVPKNFQEVEPHWKPKYSQVFEDRLSFQPNLSILDLLFCQGPTAGALIEESVRND